MSELEACKFIQCKPGIEVKILTDRVHIRYPEFEPIVGTDLIDAVKQAKEAGI